MNENVDIENIEEDIYNINDNESSSDSRKK